MVSRLITFNEVVHNGACYDGVIDFYKENFEGLTAVSIDEVLNAGADAKYLNLDGDYSYQSECPATSHNIRLLGYPFPDNSTKPIYNKIYCSVISDSGLPLYEGYLRVEGLKGRMILFSFFSGNNNWFGLLTGPISDIDFSDLDVDQNEANIMAYMSATEGMVFPLVDNGVLVSRSNRHLKLEDYVAGIYVKTVFKRIFQHHSIAIEGELINDVAYNSIITIKNSRSQEVIDANSSYVGKTTTTARPLENTDYKVTFQNDSVYPYYDGTADNWDLTNSKFVAPFKMRAEIDISLLASVIDASYNNRIYLYINGVFTFVDTGLIFGGLYNSASAGDLEFMTLKRTITLEAGDQLEVYSEWQQSGGGTQNDILSGYIKITPLFIYKVFGNATIPNWTQQEYVSNILRIFNVLTRYDQFSKTLTFNLFEKIKSKPEIDLSEYISETEVDYTAFISNYGKSNTLSYNEVTFDDLRNYNIENFFKYGQGVIEVDNDFLDASADMIESDFSNPLGYIHPIFDMSMERLNLIELDSQESTDFTTVTNATTVARFTVDKDIFLEGDLVRIEESNNISYNGDWIVSDRGAGYIEVQGLFFDSDATGRITRMLHTYNQSDDVYLLWNIPALPIEDFSSKISFVLETTDLTEFSVAYFNLLNTGRQINLDYKQSLSFGRIKHDLFYQRTLVDTYWGLVGLILNDPVSLSSIARLPYHIFLMLDFLRPIRIKTLETTNLYYLNKITGYKGSEYPSTLALIKLP